MSPKKDDAAPGAQPKATSKSEAALREDEAARHQRIANAIAFGSAFISCCALLGTVYQGCEMRDATDAQVEAFKLQYRPWLAVQDFAGPAFDSTPTDAVQVSLKNLGTLPVQGSYFIKLAWISTVKDHAPTFKELYADDRADEDQTQHFAFGAGQWIASQITATGPHYDPQVFALAKRGDTTLFICLRADYTGPDGSPGPWTYRMCFRYIPLRNAWSAYPPPKP
jgi:hypothetical protein